MLFFHMLMKHLFISEQFLIHVLFAQVSNRFSGKNFLKKYLVMLTQVISVLTSSNLVM